MAEPFTAENTIRLLDEAVRDWLRSCLFDYGTISGVSRKASPLITVAASPHRAFAATADLLVKEGWISGDTPAMQRLNASQEWPVLPLPVVTFERDDPIISNELANPAARFERRYFDPFIGEWISYPYPLHYLTQYRITFWCEKKFTQAMFMEWVMSQLGRRGAAQSEMFLEIDHGIPFGRQIHQWKYLGSSNLSDLEGPEARHIRHQLSFIMRSWCFRPADDSSPPIYAIQREAHTPGNETTPDATGDQWGTANLFTTWKSYQSWPVHGSASVVVDEQAVHAKLHLPGDEVFLANAHTTPDQFGRSLWMLAGTFTSPKPFKLQFSQFDADNAEGLAGEVAVPAGDAVPIHRFFVSNQLLVAIGIAIDGSDTTVDAADLDFRQVWPRTRLAFNDMGTAGGGDVTYIWRGLEARPYLIVCLVSPGSAAGSVTADDDETAPVDSKTESIDPASQPGFAILVMPRAGTLRLRASPALAPSALYAQGFDGPYHGSRL